MSVQLTAPNGIPRRSGAALGFPSDLVPGAEGPDQLRMARVRRGSTALQQITALDKTLQPGKPGVDVEIPVRLWFHIEQAKEMSPEPLEGIQRAEDLYRLHWEKYERSSTLQEVEAGSIRCTFVLEPLMADFNDHSITEMVLEEVELMVRENVWFSQLALWLTVDRDPRVGETDEPISALLFRKLMARVFDSNRRSYELANTKYREGIFYSDEGLRPLQLGTVHLECASWLHARDVEAMCSAMAVNQTTKKLSLRLDMNPEETDMSRQWWKWLAYALFSKRARTRSSLESVAFIFVETLSAADMEAVASILASEHPEEELCGLPRGAIDERDATLKDTAQIYAALNDGDQPSRDSPIEVTFAMRSVRCFSDDGVSELVNVLVPGFGRCLVQRTDLIFQEMKEKPSKYCGVTSLKIGFDKDEDGFIGEIPIVSNGLSRLLGLIGSQLKDLTIDGPREAVDENAILQSCPKLEELVLCEYFADVRLNFSEFQTSGQPLPTLSCHWNDIVALSADLSDQNNPLAKSVRRLRVRLMNRPLGWGAIPMAYDAINLDDHVQALLQMLEVNRSIEYLDVVAADVQEYADDFKRHNHQPTNRSTKLVMEMKAAFLSVLSFGKSQQSKRHKSSQTQPALPELDQLIVSNIFVLAATPIFREVRFRQPCDNAVTEERFQLHI
ncbi:hypothetical protein PHYSODRAFT_467111 [Phytophthora sojae]|uniref:Uncharacterized protein n=1 Tax=Phytophthora sojae (strain P6497) TaxID=1094619 RepID=G4YMU6_PHYSP|nr:hypothetical protein PHYSODRAFT_467111 [Phytophthora sojae]EGZ29291.1 hypothetical protein PHYSODRAFT_467111 [Phytophthora sojae]|eukprot:XP_009516566.1 hypothetical protein PHYSODRAFT_467111 [Phytophthora sojae]